MKNRSLLFSDAFGLQIQILPENAVPPAFIPPYIPPQPEAWDILPVVTSPPQPVFASEHNCSNASCLIRCMEHLYTADQEECSERCRDFAIEFDKWYTENRNITWTTTLKKCPCKLEKRCVDDWTSPKPPIGGYHVDAANCIRSNESAGRHANQCCYDADGDLILVGSGQGSSDWNRGDFYGYLIGDHSSQDMHPANLAKFLDGGWGCYSEAYLQVRPQVGTEECKKLLPEHQEMLRIISEIYH